MANPTKDRPQQLLHGPNIATVIAAASAGSWSDAISKPGGVVELQFGDGSAATEPDDNMDV
jgi:hypothetical protein